MLAHLISEAGGSPDGVSAASVRGRLSGGLTEALMRLTSVLSRASVSSSPSLMLSCTSVQAGPCWSKHARMVWCMHMGAGAPSPQTMVLLLLAL